MKSHWTCFVCLFFGLQTLKACPCEKAAWCQRIIQEPKHEVFAFVLSKTNWKMYDWTRLTTVVHTREINDDLTCYAHRHGVRSVHAGRFPVARLTDSQFREYWVKDQVALASKHFLDGINVDFRSVIEKNETDRRAGLSALMKELRAAYTQAFGKSQITFDVTWAPGCVNRRCYDYRAISAQTDFLFTMSYDEQSQIYGKCVASANAGLFKTSKGILQFLRLGLTPRQLVLGVPWYGYIYQCLNMEPPYVCHIKPVPYLGAPCSDIVGREVDYRDIMATLLPNSTSGIIWDDPSQSPFFNWMDPKSAKLYQIWFDNLRSLKIKYEYALRLGLRGMGMWNADSLDYSNTTSGQHQRKQMWSAIPYMRNGQYSKEYLA